MDNLGIGAHFPLIFLCIRSSSNIYCLAMYISVTYIGIESLLKLICIIIAMLWCLVQLYLFIILFLRHKHTYLEGITSDDDQSNAGHLLGTCEDASE